MPDAVANLLLAGVPKAGTTSLFEYLGQHPDICASAYKGPGYFSPLRRGEALPSLATYNQNFAHCKGQRYAMEATPGYCYGGRRLVEGIERTLDEPNIIISLRDPVDRLWSSYTWQRSRGHLATVESFEKYVS
ncbi:MAG: sulfotransferase domain-containing protein, partial [Acidobacteria bacterium]|nr:sulfotransferase domain-containing protein [Acidobacteriota bacterium]